MALRSSVHAGLLLKYLEVPLGHVLPEEDFHGSDRQQFTLVGSRPASGHSIHPGHLKLRSIQLSGHRSQASFC